MIEAYKKMFANYAKFSGRACRAEYWWVVLCQVIIYVILYVMVFAGVIIDSNVLATLGSGIMILYSLGTFIPLLALTMRRLHDSNKSGWFIIMQFLPCLNFVLLVFMFLDGTPGVNQYGEPSSIYSSPSHNDRSKTL